MSSLTKTLKNLFIPLPIHKYSTLILIIMKEEGSKVFEIVKINSALDFISNFYFLASTLKDIIFDKIQCTVF